MILSTAVLIALAVGTLCCGGLAVLVARYGQSPGDRLITVLSLAGVLWAATYGIALGITDPTLRMALEVPLWLGKLVVPITWFLAVLSYTGRESYVSPWVVALLSAPMVTTLALMTVGHELVWQGYEVVLVEGLATAGYELGPWLTVQTAFSYALIVVGILLLLEVLTANVLFRRQGIALCLSAALAMVVNLKWFFRLGPAPTLDLSPIVFPVTAGVIGYALVNYDLFSLSPAAKRAGKQAAIDDFGDSVFVIDTRDRVVDVNETGVELLGDPKAAIVGRQIDEALGVEVFDPDATEAVRIESADGTREFGVTCTAVSDRRDRTIGWTVLLHDVTRARRRQQRLAVLDRVMRHNIRNSMSVVQCCAQELAERDADNAELADRIERESSHLVDLGATARTIEEVVGREPDRHAVQVPTALSGVRDRLRAETGVEQIEIETGADWSIETDGVILEEVLFHAGRYFVTDRDEPAITVVANHSADGTTFGIVGDGLSVPPQERRAIETGRESPLEHTDDLDLWLVKWGIERLGGTLAFDREIDDGRTAAILVRLSSRRSEPESAA